MSLEMESTADDPGPPPFFIITTSLAKPDPKTRKLIRSHVMRGKNAGKFRNSKHLPCLQAQPQPPDEGARGESSGGGPSGQERHGIKTEPECWTLVTPRKIASELSLCGLSGDMQPYVPGLIHRAFMVIKPAIYGLEDVVSPNSSDDKLFCLANFSTQPGILHSTLFAAQAFHDLAMGRPFSTIAQLHLATALRHLQRSLDDEKAALDLSTMAVVASLAMAAVVAGDLATAVKHMDGLRRIVELRGGLKSLGPGSMIEHKARAIDLGLAMGLGHNLRFPQDDAVSWSPQIAHGRGSTRFPELAPAFALYQRPDPRLLNVWADLREFSRLVNEAAARRTKVPVETVSQMARSVPYRLLRLGPDKTEGLLRRDALLHELLRLCMLAYVRMLLIKLRGIGRKMTALADGLRAVLGAWYENLGRHVPRESAGVWPVSGDAAGPWMLLLWGAFVSSVSIFEDSVLDEEWLVGMVRQAVAMLGLQTWVETRAVLKEFLWIDVVFDGPGQKLFARVDGAPETVQ